MCMQWSLTTSLRAHHKRLPFLCGITSRSDHISGSCAICYLLNETSYLMWYSGRALGNFYPLLSHGVTNRGKLLQSHAVIVPFHLAAQLTSYPFSSNHKAFFNNCVTSLQALKRAAYTDPNNSCKCLTWRQVVLKEAAEGEREGRRCGPWDSLIRRDSANKIEAQVPVQSGGHRLVQMQERALIFVVILWAQWLPLY